MARKDLGQIELQWTCPNCGGINPGPDKFCNQCGAAQPEEVEFEQADRQQIISEEEKESQSRVGPDIHCPFCGTRNPGNAKKCLQCGGDLVEGRKRQSGRVVGAYHTGPEIKVKCPHCGQENPNTAKICSHCGGSMHIEREPAAEPTIGADTPRILSRPWVLVLAILVVVVLCGVGAWFAILANRTEAVTGVVEGIGWERSVPIEALVPVSHSGWWDEIPGDAEVGACSQEIRYVQSQPAPNSVEVCGTPYTVDTGNGYADVVQDCEYQVYDDYCDYTVQEWSVVDTVSLNGNDSSPAWPDPPLEDGQRLGENWTESYVIYFDTSQGPYTYTTTDYDLFMSAQPGTEWDLNINSFGSLLYINR